MNTKRRQRGVVTIRVPTTERGKAGFIKKLHEAFLADKRVVFDGDHSTVARILWGFDPPVVSRSVPHGTDTRQMRHTTRRRRVVTVKVPTEKRDREKFKRDVERFNERVKDVVSDWKQVKFDGDHTTIARVCQHRIVRYHITDMFISMVKDKKILPWERPWTDGRWVRPRSMRGRIYSPFNAFRLAQVAVERDYRDSRWLTREYAEQVGHPVQRKEMDRGTALVRAWPKPVVVYNFEQCEGVEKEEVKKEPTLPVAQAVIDKYRRRERQLGLKVDHNPIPDIPFYCSSHTHTKSNPFYCPSEDPIVLLTEDQYSDQNKAEYYMSAFHEIAHSTGLYKRLDRRDRDKPAPSGSHAYGREELVAEMAASLLAAETDLTFEGKIVKTAGAYVKSWLNKIEEDPSILWKAASDAGKAVDYVLDRNGARKKARDRADKRERKRKAKERERARTKK